MLWIQSDCDIREHPKFLDLLNYSGLGEDVVLGKLHRFWHWVMKFAENGDLRKFNDGQLCRALGFSEIEAGKTFIESMVKACWLDRKPYFRVHDWWDYAGKYLQNKYKKTPEKWEAIKVLYYPPLPNHYRTTTEPLLQTIPNQTAPNLSPLISPPIQPEKSPEMAYSEDFLCFWAAYPRKVGKDAAWGKWKQKNPPIKVCLQALELQKCQPKWKEEGGKYIPHPKTWINQGRWQDEVEPEQTDKDEFYFATYFLRKYNPGDYTEKQIDGFMQANKNYINQILAQASSLPVACKILDLYAQAISKTDVDSWSLKAVARRCSDFLAEALKKEKENIVKT